MKMNIHLFEKIIKTDKSIELDFTKEHYKLLGEKEEDTTNIVKDIIAFSNTIRENSAFIIIGILEENGKKELLGINNPMDDKILQSKIKNKVYPRPRFKYINFEYQSKVFGIVEIPVRRYPETIKPSIKMKGLEVGKVYCREGSSNIEANGREIIAINNWITKLPEHSEDFKIRDEISNLISEISANTEPLSFGFSKGLKIANATNDDELLKFCKSELEGYYGDVLETQYLEHRKVEILISVDLIESNPPDGNPEIENFWKELKSKEHFHQTTILRNEKINKIEDTLNSFKTKGMNRYKTEEKKYKDVFNSDEFGDMPLYFYSGFDTFNLLYKSIKNRFIDVLMKRI
jgi:hypothetical protein